MTKNEGFDIDRAERQIREAIASGQYEAADRLIGEEEMELAGGVYYDLRNLRRALVKGKLGRYADGGLIIEDVLLDPTFPHRDTALAIRKWLAERQDSTHNKTPEPSVAPAPQVQR